MKILFINPKFLSGNYINYVEEIAKKGWANNKFLYRDIKKHERSMKFQFSCLGLLTLASSLPKEINFTFIDENLENDENLKNIYENEKYDIVAITSNLFCIEKTFQLVKYFLEKGIYVVIGGPQATIAPDDYIQKGVSVIIGEGEELWEEFLNDFKKNIPKPVYKSKNFINIEKIPTLDFSIISKYNYRWIGVETSRGCPYSCSFCNVSKISGKKYRNKPIIKIKEEIKLVKKFWQNSVFFFYDNNPFSNKNYARELFKELKDIDLGTWSCFADISISNNSELLNLISSNGKHTFLIGLETLSKKNDKILNNKMKSQYSEKYSKSIEILKNKGINVIVSFIFGFPEDTKEDLIEIFEFMKKEEVFGTISIFAANPYSKIYEDLLIELEREKIEKYTVNNIKKINDFFMQKNGHNFEDIENMIIDVAKNYNTLTAPIESIIAPLASYRAYMGMPIKPMDLSIDI